MHTVWVGAGSCVPTRGELDESLCHCKVLHTPRLTSSRRQTFDRLYGEDRNPRTATSYSGKVEVHEDAKWIQEPELCHCLGVHILQDDIEAQESLAPYLPQSNVAWARSSRLLKPLPRHFITLWLRNLLKKPKPLSKAQERKYQENLALFQPEQHELMHDITQCYDGCPTMLKCALYRFSQAILK